MKKYTANIPHGIYSACRTNNELDIFISQNQYYYLDLKKKSKDWFEQKIVKIENGILEIIK